MKIKDYYDDFDNSEGGRMNKCPYCGEDAALLRRAVEVVEDKASEAYELDYMFCLECNEEWGYGHKEGCGVGKAQALAPDLRAELEKAK